MERPGYVSNCQLLYHQNPPETSTEDLGKSLNCLNIDINQNYNTNSAILTDPTFTSEQQVEEHLLNYEIKFADITETKYSNHRCFIVVFRNQDQLIEALQNPNFPNNTSLESVSQETTKRMLWLANLPPQCANEDIIKLIRRQCEIPLMITIIGNSTDDNSRKSALIEMSTIRGATFLLEQTIL